MPTTKNMVAGAESTITQFISDYNTDEVIMSAFYLGQVISTNNGYLITNMDNIVLKYYPELETLKKKIVLSNTEYYRYRFNPKQMSYDVYGTTELWWLILEANGLHSVSQFDLKSVVLYRTDIFDKLNRILNLESGVKDINEETIQSELKASS